MRLRRGTFAAVLWLLAGPALADTVLPIGAAFGNEAGCAMYMSGDRSPPDLAVLTPHTFTTHNIGCYFETLISNRDGKLEVAALCATPEDRREKATVVVEGNRSAGYTVTKGADSWGPLTLCPGMEELFTLPGVQV